MLNICYLLIGHIFWQYEFGHKLDEGGYGCVYAGTRCKDGLKVSFFFYIPFLHSNFQYLFSIRDWNDLCAHANCYFFVCWTGGCENCWQDTKYAIYQSCK